MRLGLKSTLDYRLSGETRSGGYLHCLNNRRTKMDMNVPRELLLPAPSRSTNSTEAPKTEYFFSEQLSAFYDAGQHAMWLRWTPGPRPNFNPGLLQDLDRYCQFVSRSGGIVEDKGRS